MKFGKNLLGLWNLRQDVTFLNHGSFGACPIEVLDAAHRYEMELEKEPVNFLLDVYPQLAAASRKKLAGFLNADEAGLGFVENASSGLCSIIREFETLLRPGDEVLITNHVYPAVRNALQYSAGRAGFRIVTADADLPFGSSFDISEAIERKISERTRAIVIDHVTSACGAVFPVIEIAGHAKSKGLITVVDGAHAPGFVPLDLQKVPCDWYVGNCHKWMCAPKGAAFIYASEERREMTHPLNIANNHGMPFRDEFDWQGSKNPAPWIAVGDAIDFFEKFGWNEVRDYNNTLARAAKKILLESVGSVSEIPDDMIGSMAAFTIPESLYNRPADTKALRYNLFSRHSVEVPVMEVSGRVMIRVSAQIYNELPDYEKLADILRGYIKRGIKIA